MISQQVGQHFQTPEFVYHIIGDTRPRHGNAVIYLTANTAAFVLYAIQILFISKEIVFNISCVVYLLLNALPNVVRLQIVFCRKHIKRIVQRELDLFRTSLQQSQSQKVRPIANVDLHTAEQEEQGAKLRMNIIIY